MELKRRKDWQKDIPTSQIVEFYTCICCPDSNGFSVNDGEIKIKKPICNCHGSKVLLKDFPFIPFWCPRLDPYDPIMTVNENNMEKLLYKKQCWNSLSREAKLVLNVLFNLPEEFLSRQKILIKSLISNTIRMYYIRYWKAERVDDIYRELKDFTHKLSH